MSDIHFNQVRRRKAEFITPPNVLKQKVGSGGLGEDILNKAQKLLEENTIDFHPMANRYLGSLMDGIEMSKGVSSSEVESVIASMIYPTMQLKANGSMFHFSLITDIAEKLINFLEVIEEPDIESVEIILAFHTTMRAVLQGNVVGDGGESGKELLVALNDACVKYFSKTPS